MSLTSTTGYGQIAVFYEHPVWFKPLFAELDSRGVTYDRLLAYEHQFDPAELNSQYHLVFNRMSPSAFTRGHTQAIFYSLQYLAHLKDIGARVINGYDPYLYEFSKARQIGLLRSLGLRHPRTRVISNSSQATQAAQNLEFPVIVKPNIGGSGAKIVRFNSLDELSEASQLGLLDLGIDHTTLVQEYLPAEGDYIVRVEILGGEYLYAIRLYLTAGEFNLCPADYCKTPAQSSATATPDGVSGRDLPIEGYTPPVHVVDDVKRIIHATGAQLGGVEYLVNSRDGKIYYYDINALSNFVRNAPEVVGFDPYPRLVDYLLSSARLPQIVS